MKMTEGCWEGDLTSIILKTSLSVRKDIGSPKFYLADVRTITGKKLKC